VTEVYLEVGKRKVFACAVAWPGWCRAGRGEEAALAALAGAAPRYATMCDRAGILAGVRAGAVARPPADLARSRRPARFVARRTAWHAMDHAWEIEYKRDP
jgi:hypothetical protein